MLQPPGALHYCSGCGKNLERTQSLFTKPQLGVTYYQVVALLLAGWSMVRLCLPHSRAGLPCPAGHLPMSLSFPRGSRSTVHLSLQRASLG